jgi:hypothetical protein
MTIKEFTPNRTINLSAEEGNVFCLIGMSNRMAKTLELDGPAIAAEMMSHDYGNAVYVFNREYGDFFDIILPHNMTLEGLKRSYAKANATPEVVEDGYLK